MEFPEPGAIRNQSLPVGQRYRLMRVWQAETQFLRVTGRHATAREFAPLVLDLRVEAILSASGIDETPIEEGLRHEAG